MNFTRLFIIPAVLVSGMALAQQTYINTNSGRIDYIYNKKAASEAATGSQYYIENFSAARIDGSNEISSVRYNAYNDELEVKVGEEIKILQPKENQVITLTNGKAAYEYVQYVNEDKNTNQNYLVIVSNQPKVKIYKKEKITLEPEKQPTGGYQKYKAPAYKKEDAEYYIKMNDGQATWFKNKSKDVARLVPGKENEIKEYIKKNKIDVSEDAGLDRLGQYLNTIL